MDQCANVACMPGDVLLARQVTVLPPLVVMAVRPSVGEWHYLRVSAEDLGVEVLNTSQYLAFQERLAGEWVDR
jgi:Sucrose synthase